MLAAAASPTFPRAGWRRLLFALALSIATGLLLGLAWKSSLASVLIRSIALGLVALLMFALFERWPRRLPAWLARWALQVGAIAIAMPLVTLAIYLVSTPAGAPPFWQDRDRLEGFMALTFFSAFVAPWAALAALVRQKDALARHQALAFELERSNARLRLLQAQVAPHFLFNTLANVQALVDAGSPRASALLRSLIAYLRAAVPLLDEPAATLGREVELVRAYLELMHMRMPDRLQFEMRVDDGALALPCPPTTLLTLVENAVRHGIDPSEEGGRIEIEVRLRGNRCLIRVSDSGVGLQASSAGLGTGLSALRERLQLAFGGEAQLRVSAGEARGVVSEVELPGR